MVEQPRLSSKEMVVLDLLLGLGSVAQPDRHAAAGPHLGERQHAVDRLGVHDHHVLEVPGAVPHLRDLGSGRAGEHVTSDAQGGLADSEREISVHGHDGPRGVYALDLVARSDGRLGRGTVYVTLNRMEDKRLVESSPEIPPPGWPGYPRRLYRATGHGERTYRAVLAAAMHLRELEGVLT